MPWVLKIHVFLIKFRLHYDALKNGCHIEFLLVYDSQIFNTKALDLPTIEPG